MYSVLNIEGSNKSTNIFPYKKKLCSILQLIKNDKYLLLSILYSLFLVILIFIQILYYKKNAKK